MLHRTSSSRRRRASRSAATSPQARSPRASVQPSRRASLAATETDEEMEPTPPPQRSPRASLAPDAALDYHRSPRHSLVPEVRSARNSITPDTALQPRNSLAPSRNNLAVDMNYGSRLSLNPQDFNRSPRNSITPDANARSPRRSLVPEGTSWNQPRNSLVPDVGRSPRHSVASIQIDPARSQKDLGPSPRTSPRGSGGPEPTLKKEIPEINRSPRGSLIPDSQRSPRGSIAPSERSARGSLVTGEGEANRVSPRGSLTLTFQEPLVSRERRPSEDSQTAGTRGRSVSPYRASVAGRQTGAGVPSDTGSRRASSSVSQVSGDEQRRLCGEQAKYSDRTGLGLGMGLTTYGSVAYQLKDANMEASGTVDFVCRAAKIMNRTILMTAFLILLSTLPIIMTIMGVHYIRDCPAEPRIPVYMIVGGVAGCAGIGWLLFTQLLGRHSNSSASVPERILAYLLTIFLMGWTITADTDFARHAPRCLGKPSYSWRGMCYACARVCIRQLLDSRHHVARLRTDTVRAEPVVPQNIVRVRTDSAGSGVGVDGLAAFITAGSRRMSGVRLWLAWSSEIQVATAQRRARAMAQKHQQHHGRGRRSASLHTSRPPRAHHPRTGGAHSGRQGSRRPKAQNHHP